MSETHTNGFEGNSITTTGDTHQAALAAAASASVNARFIMAIQRPRSWDDVRVRLLKECARPGFAEVARYNKPIGKGVRGPSIRFAEACFRYSQNMDAPVTTTFEDRFKRILHVQIVDFESNASYSADITIDKTVERREIKDRSVLSQRKNSSGNTVFLVEATEDELLNKQNALVSKALRTLILRMIPGDIIEEGQKACVATLDREDAKDPAMARKRMVDRFAELGIMPRDLEALVGHSLDALQPAELAELRDAYATVRDGEGTWRSILEAKRPNHEGGAATDFERELREQAPSAVIAEAPPAKRATTRKATPAPSSTVTNTSRVSADYTERGRVEPPAPNQPISLAKPGVALEREAKPNPPCVYCGVPVEEQAIWVTPLGGWRHLECRERDPNNPTGASCAVCGNAVADDAIKTATAAGPRWRHPDCSPFAEREPGQEG